MLFSNNLIQTAKDLQSYNNSVRNVNILDEQNKKDAEASYTNALKKVDDVNLSIEQLNILMYNLKLRVDWLDRLTEALL